MNIIDKLKELKARSKNIDSKYILEQLANLDLTELDTGIPGWIVEEAKETLGFYDALGYERYESHTRERFEKLANMKPTEKPEPQPIEDDLWKVILRVADMGDKWAFNLVHGMPFDPPRKPFHGIVYHRPDIDGIVEEITEALADKGDYQECCADCVAMFHGHPDYPHYCQRYKFKQPWDIFIKHCGDSFTPRTQKIEPTVVELGPFMKEIRWR